MADYQYPNLSPLTTLEAAQANTLAAVTVQVGNINENLRVIYLTAFANWALSIEAGRSADNTNPPIPPKAYVVAKSADGWAYPGPGTDPVCAMPPIPEVTPPQVPVYFEGNDSVMNVPPKDKMPVGYVATSPDGSKWRKTASPTPFGMAYYYARVA
jgi:hypothetical protein